MSVPATPTVESKTADDIAAKAPARVWTQWMLTFCCASLTAPSIPIGGTCSEIGAGSWTRFWPPHRPLLRHLLPCARSTATNPVQIMVTDRTYGHLGPPTSPGGSPRLVAGMSPGCRRDVAGGVAGVSPG